jgi:hypothetical protein
VFGDEQKDVKRQPGDGEADADAGQDHHHLAVPLHLALLPTRVAGKAGIFSEKLNIFCLSNIQDKHGYYEQSWDQPILFVITRICYNQNLLEPRWLR